MDEHCAEDAHKWLLLEAYFGPPDDNDADLVVRRCLRCAAVSVGPPAPDPPPTR